MLNKEVPNMAGNKEHKMGEEENLK